MQHTAQAAEENDVPIIGEGDTVIYLDEIDVETIKQVYEKVSDDPFLRVKEQKLPKKYRQKLNRLQKKSDDETDELNKKFVGIEGAESKYVDPETVTGYSLFDLVEPPYDMSALAQLYDENYALHAVIEARVMNTVGLGVKWSPTTKAVRQIEKAAGDEEKSARIRTAHIKEKDKLTQLFDDFNEEETFVESLIKVWTDCLATGNGYMEIGRTSVSRKIGYVGHVPSNLVRVRRMRDGFVQQANHIFTFFRNFGDEETVDPIHGDSNANELIHFKLYSPTNNWYGVPPSVSALTAIIGDKFAKEYNIDYFENKTIPRYAIILKGVKLSNKGKIELIEYFKNELKGKNHGTLIIPLPATIGNQSQADVKFEKLEADVQEASFDKYRKSNRDEILVAYRTPPTKVAIFENANLAVSRDADKTFKSQVISPDQNSVQNRSNRIVREFTDLFLLEFEQFDLTDEDTKSRIHDRMLRTQVLTPNEVREDMGHQPIPGGDWTLPYPDPNLKYTMALTESEGKLYTEKTGNLAPMAGSDVGKLQAKPPDPGGGEPGNAGGKAGSPQKSGEDNGKSPSNKDVVGTNADRGQLQDQGKTRDRTGG